MKIRFNNELYIQRIDLLYLKESHIPILESIYQRINNNNKYKFIKFTNPEEVSFLDSIPWVIDYNEVKDLTTETIAEMINNLSVQKMLLLKQLKNQEEKDQLNTYTQIQIIKFKILSLTEILWYKYGSTEVRIPKKIKHL